MPFEDGFWLKDAQHLAELFDRPAGDRLQLRGQHRQGEFSARETRKGLSRARSRMSSWHLKSRISRSFSRSDLRARPTRDAASQGIRLAVVKLSAAKHGFVLLPKRWLVERSIAWLARFRRLARDYERLPETLAGLHFLAFACLLLSRFAVKLRFST